MIRSPIGAVVALVLVVGVSFVASADVKPGDVITPANKEKVKGLIPAELYPYVIENNPDLKMIIVPTQDWTPAEKYVEATVKYACQATIDKDGNLANFTAGQPFPFSDWATKATNHACDLKPTDPQFGLKLAWDLEYRWQGSGLNFPHWGFSFYRDRGKDMWQLAQGEYRRTYFSHRADLLPKTTDLEPNTDVEYAEFFNVKAPFNQRGLLALKYRYLDSPQKDDDLWVYVPALRRVRRVAASQQSDSLNGTEFTVADFYLFSGYVWNQKWEYKGQSEVLAPVEEHHRTCFPNNISPESATKIKGMVRLGSEEQFRSCKFGPYGVLPFVNQQFEKRTVIELDQIPKEKGNPYSRKKIWVDKQTMTAGAAIAYDRAGAPYRIFSTEASWSANAPNPASKGLRIPVGLLQAVANVQSGASNASVDWNANYYPFSVQESRRYYDTSRLRRAHR